MVIRNTPTAENLKLLYDVINEIMPDLDVYYTPAELGEILNGKEKKWEKIKHYEKSSC